MTITPTPFAPTRRHRVAAAVLGLFLLAGPCAAQSVATPAAPQNKQDYSVAERLLFMTPQLTRLKAPVTLGYSFRKSGTLEEAFDDRVAIALGRQGDGRCCTVQGEFLTGARRMTLPEIENPEANPVLLYFLEHDVREMQRITKGSQAYYRKRIRMAVYEAATVTEVSLAYRGKAVKAQRVEIDPYANDPARSRFEKFARKTYQFFLTDEVPGGVFGMRSVMRGAGATDAPLVVEELLIDGAAPLQPLPAS